jgi:hypothetical protein
VRYARDGDFILVTNNASDFRRLYVAQLLHAGLIIVVPVVDGLMPGPGSERDGCRLRDR